MYVTLTPMEIDPMVELLFTLAQRTNPPLSGTTQKEIAREEGRRTGFKEGIYEGMKTILNQRRCEAYKHWDKVPLLAAYDVRQVANGFVEQIHSSDINDKAVLDALIAEFKDAMQALANPLELSLQELERHKEAVLNGTEEATADDVGWLEAERKQRLEAANRYVALLEKIAPTKE